jgi:hypothetical protein
MIGCKKLSESVSPLNIQEVTLFFVIFGSLTCYVTYLVDHQVLCQILPTRMMGLQDYIFKAQHARNWQLDLHLD